MTVVNIALESVCYHRKVVCLQLINYIAKPQILPTPTSVGGLLLVCQAFNQILKIFHAIFEILDLDEFILGVSLID